MRRPRKAFTAGQEITVSNAIEILKSNSEKIDSYVRYGGKASNLSRILFTTIFGTEYEITTIQDYNFVFGN